MTALRDAGYVARALQVSHAFHTRIVAPAGDSLAIILGTMGLRPPDIPIVSNVTGEFYPMGPGVVPEMIALLGKQVSSPVQFIKGLNTLYAAGARVFVEMGPKRILYGFVEDVLGEREGVVSLFTNHPRIGDASSLNLALCGLYAAGLGFGEARKEPVPEIRASRPFVAHAAPSATIAARLRPHLPTESISRQCRRRNLPPQETIATTNSASSLLNSWTKDSRFIPEVSVRRLPWISASRAHPWDCPEWTASSAIRTWIACCAATFS